MTSADRADWADQAAAVLTDVTDAPVRDHATRDFGREVYGEARSVIVPAPDAERLLAAVRSQLPSGVAAFVGTSRWLGDEQPDGVELVVVPAGDALTPLEVVGTTAEDLGLDTAALRQRLAPLDRYSIDIVGAETDRLSFRLRRPPDDPSDAVDVVVALAPDLPTDDESLAELGRSISAGETIELWWD